MSGNGEQAAAPQLPAWDEPESLVRQIVEAFRDASHPSVDIAVEEIMMTFADHLADTRRLDWLQARAMDEDFEDRAGIRIERYTGNPVKRFTDAAFRLREWGDTPLDGDGELDYSRRPYRQRDFATLRRAIDVGMREQLRGGNADAPKNQSPRPPRV